MNAKQLHPALHDGVARPRPAGAGPRGGASGEMNVLIVALDASIPAEVPDAEVLVVRRLTRLVPSEYCRKCDEPSNQDGYRAERNG